MAVDTRTVLATCVLSRWSGNPRRCNWCDRGLVGRQRRWCSQLCSRNFTKEHDWSAAREAAKRRDGYRCVRCGAGPHEVDNAIRQYLRLLGIDPEQVQLSSYQLTDWYQTIVLERSLEVNHIKPRLGQGYGFGCHHHVVGLETCCHRCHVQVTAAQRAGLLKGSATLLPDL